MKLTESEIKQENVVAEHSAAINAISEWWKVVESFIAQYFSPLYTLYTKNLPKKYKKSV